jgi:integrase
MGTIRFILRTDKLQKTGKAPIELVYQISKQRKYFYTGQKLYPANWNADNQQPLYIDRKTAKKLPPPAIDYDLLLSEKEADEVQDNLTQLQKEIKDIEKRFVMDKEEYSVEMVIDKLKEIKKPITKKTEPSKVLYDFIDKYIEDNAATREPGSLTVYRSMKNHLQAYEKKTKKKITFDSIDYDFFQSFQNFLIGRKKVMKSGELVPMLNNTTIAKQLSTVKTFLNYAKKKKVVVSDEYKDFKIKKDQLEVIALTNEEFETLFNLDLSNKKKLAYVRDVFCFACVTGLRYSDMNQLKREHIKEEEIKLTVIKTNQLLTIPLTPYSKAILAKYEAHHKPLPMISNQRLNDYVKELCEYANINEPIEIVRYRGNKREAITYPKYELIGVHTGRKTFVTLSLEKKISAEVVMAITGHKDYKSFQRYINVTEERKKAGMLTAWGGNISELKLKAI